jgi:hypothetical protein
MNANYFTFFYVVKQLGKIQEKSLVNKVKKFVEKG